MGYFPNGTAGELYEEEYCTHCVHYGNCAVWDAHMEHNYDECNNPKSILHDLIPLNKEGVYNEKCLMFFDKEVHSLKPEFIEVDARVRYWEDANVNGVEDADGKIPLRDGYSWRPVIELSSGRVKDWPNGTSADIHYKVCDDGDYWLLDGGGTRIAKYDGNGYVPCILCVDDDGYGDYIILNIRDDGLIIGWKEPAIDINSDAWNIIND